MNNSKEVWGEFWESSHFSFELDQKIIKEEFSSLIWKKISKKILHIFNSFKGLKTVEIGCGRGEISLLMALQGAEVTLIDSNAEALEKAKALFARFNCQAIFLQYDIFNLPQEFFNKFDISLSFGLAEHFYYPQRKEIFQIHLNLIKEGGIVFVGIPNAWCLAYRIFKVVSEFLGYWKVGLEIPFSHQELKKIAAALKCKNYEVFGGSFLKDAYYFTLVRPIQKITKQKIRLSSAFLEIPTILDNYFGYLVLACENKLKKINILYAISTASVGGGEQHLLSLADRLNKDKYNLFFVIPSEGIFADELRKRNLSILVLNMKGKFKPSAFFKIINFIKNSNIDIAHAHGARLGFYLRIAAKLAGVPVVISTVHISIYDYPIANWLKGLYIFLDNLTLRLCDKIICVSGALAQELTEKANFDSKKVILIYNGIDLARFSVTGDTDYLKKEFALGSDRIIGVVSRLVKHKGHKYLLAAIKKLISNFADIKCLIVGDGPMRLQLEELVNELGISRSCIFTGNRKDIPQILSLLDVLVLPSLSEGFPLILLEGMAMRRPIVATRIAGVLEMIEDGKSGILVALRDSAAIADAVTRLLQDPLTAKKMGEAARTLVEKHYNVEQMIEKLENLYDSLILEKG